MGNQPSKPPSRSTTQHEKDERQQRHQRDKEREKELEREREGDREREKERDRQKEKDKKVNRRISFPVLAQSHPKAIAADPSATTESAHAQPILQSTAQKLNLQQHLQSTTSQSPERYEKNPAPFGRSISPAVINQDQQEVPRRPREMHLPMQAPDLNPKPSIPMDVPSSNTNRHARHSRVGSATSRATPPASTPQYTPISVMQRPPRLPLAIANEVRAPEWPPSEPVVTLSEEISIFDDDEADLPRKSSVLSSTTIEEEDVGSELQPYAVDTGGVNVVDTRIDWKGSGERVYVTGTFAHWDKKYRLHKR